MKKVLSLFLALVLMLSLFACAKNETPAPAQSGETEKTEEPATQEPQASEEKTEATPAEEPAAESTEAVDPASTFDRTLDDYTPKKTSYKIYFNYKNIHVWYDAIELGIQEAVKQYADKGITVEYEWIGSADPDAADQVTRVEEAVGRNFDVICVEPANLDLIAPSVTNLVNSGVKVMCFGASDLFGYEESSGRYAYVGAGDPSVDAIPSAEAFCEAIGYKGKVALLGGTIGAPGHEMTNQAFLNTIAKYPDIELVDTQYDNDELDKAISLTENFLQKTPDLAGIYCNNMTNPIGAAQAVTAAGKAGEIVIVGMDHDIQALEYLRDGTIYALAILDCFGIGFDALQTAIKIADDCTPGVDYEKEIYYHLNTVYQNSAEAYIKALYPNY